jgi:hypothetical protein
MTNNLTPTADNIIDVWNRATAEQVSSGLTWYADAHDLALDLADGDAVKGAGVLAALSPQEAWTRNIVLARQAFSTEGLQGGTLGRSIANAARILAGEHPLDVLGNGDARKALKTRAFYANIVDPADSFTVTIDRHAFDVALNLRAADNKRVGLTPTRYAAFSEAYRAAADTLGVLPQQVQAVTWTAWRERWAWKKDATLVA